MAYSWLYEVAVYSLHAAFGLTGIVLFRMALSLAVVAAIFALVHRLEAPPDCRRAVRLATLAIAMLFSERPWLFTVLFSTLTLHAVLALRDEQRPPPRWIWSLPLIFIVWANCHIQFVYGLLLLALACLAHAAAAVVRRPLRRRSTAGDGGRLAALAAADPAERPVPAGDVTQPLSCAHLRRGG